MAERGEGSLDNMRVLMRSSSGVWKSVGNRSYQREKELQGLLETNPQILPMADLDKDIPTPKVMLSEAGLRGSGQTDLIGVDETGGITLIECKLDANAEIKRKVVGQVIEYAGQLWAMPYRDFSALFERKRHKDLFTLMSDVMADGHGLQRMSFPRALKTPCARGVFVCSWSSMH